MSTTAPPPAEAPADLDPRLVWVLRRCADEWGALGVLRAAARLWPDAADDLIAYGAPAADAAELDASGLPLVAAREGARNHPGATA